MAAADAVLTTVGAGKRWVVKQVVIVNNNTTTTRTVLLAKGTTATAGNRWMNFPIPPGETVGVQPRPRPRGDRDDQRGAGHRHRLHRDDLRCGAVDLVSGPILLTRAHRWRNGLPVFLTTAERDLNIVHRRCRAKPATSMTTPPPKGLQTFSGTGMAAGGVEHVVGSRGDPVNVTANQNGIARLSWT
jgi:hypothetical protein